MRKNIFRDVWPIPGDVGVVVPETDWKFPITRGVKKGIEALFYQFARWAREEIYWDCPRLGMRLVIYHIYFHYKILSRYTVIYSLKDINLIYLFWTHCKLQHDVKLFMFLEFSLITFVNLLNLEPVNPNRIYKTYYKNINSTHNLQITSVFKYF